MTWRLVWGRNGVGLEVDIFCWVGLGIWRETGSGLGMGLGWAGEGAGYHDRCWVRCFLREGFQCHACQDTADDVGEV